MNISETKKRKKPTDTYCHFHIKGYTLLGDNDRAVKVELRAPKLAHRKHLKRFNSGGKRLSLSQFRKNSVLCVLIEAMDLRISGT